MALPGHTSLFSVPALGFPGFLSAMGVLCWGVWMLLVPTKQRKLYLIWGLVFAEVQMRTAPWGGNAAFLIPHPFDLQCPPDHFTFSLDSGASPGGRGGAGDGEGQAASVISIRPGNRSH